MRRQILFLLIGILFLGCVVSFATDAVAEEQVVISVDYMEKLQKIVTPTGYNPQRDARQYYEKATSAIAYASNELEIGDRYAWPEDLNALKLKAMQDWIKANEEALEMLPRATALPYYVPKYKGYQGDSLVDIKVPEVFAMANLAHVSCARAKIRAAAGQHKEALYDCIRCYRLGQHFGGEKVLIDQGVGSGIRAKSAQAFREILARTSIDVILLRRVQAELDRLVKKEPLISFSVERLTMLDLIQRTFTDDGKGGGQFTPNVDAALKNMFGEWRKYDPKFAEWEKKWKNLDRRETTTLAERAWDFMDSIVDKSPAYLRKVNKNPSEVLSKMVQDNAFVSMFIDPTLLKLVERNYQTKTEMEAVIAILGLLRYKADKGVFPERLEELKLSRYIKSLPIDPYTDKPLAYKRTGESFMLYSLGVDFDDDGGTHSKWGRGKAGGDQVFWPMQGRQK